MRAQALGTAWGRRLLQAAGGAGGGETACRLKTCGGAQLARRGFWVVGCGKLRRLGVADGGMERERARSSRMEEVTGSGGCWGGRRRRGGAWRRGWIRDGGGGAEWALCARVLWGSVSVWWIVVWGCGLVFGSGFFSVSLYRECFLRGGGPARSRALCGWGRVGGWGNKEVCCCGSAPVPKDRPCAKFFTQVEFQLNLKIAVTAK